VLLGRKGGEWGGGGAQWRPCWEQCNQEGGFHLLTCCVAPGCFDERVFRGLDWVLAEAGKRGIKIMLVLVNHWSAYGGMAQYVKYASLPSGRLLQK